MKDRNAILLVLVILALMYLVKQQRDSDTLTVQGRTLLGPGLWTTDDWTTWRRKS